MGREREQQLGFLLRRERGRIAARGVELRAQTAVGLSHEVEKLGVEPRERIAIVQIRKREPEGEREHGVAGGAHVRPGRAGIDEFIHQKHIIMAESGAVAQDFRLIC